MVEKKSIKILRTVILIILPIATAIIALMIGRIAISPKDVFLILTGQGDMVETVSRMTVISFRLPRIILALFVGAGLSVAGCAFQGLFANPLATPDTLGVASGASFGASVAILLGFNAIPVQISSFIFGILAVVLTVLCGRGKGKGMTMIILSGIMIGSLFSALISFVKYVADAESQLPAITYWLMGSLASTDYKSLIVGVPPILIGILILFILRWRMNLLPLTEDEIKSSGTNVLALRAATVLAATAITAASVSMCGQVGWIGLLVPHMVRMRLGSNFKTVVPASISIGAVFLVVVDTVARSLTASEIPISILTAIIGAPFFIYLMRRGGSFR
ncbi:MAG: iron ABC transporter permease [Lachnospiraceae bacterium]|nr:iron ABC transporter permease [Lachnospiraceae bacterium]